MGAMTLKNDQGQWRLYLHTYRCQSLASGTDDDDDDNDDDNDDDDDDDDDESIQYSWRM